LDPADKRTEEPIDDLLAEAVGAQRIDRCLIRLTQQIRGSCSSQAKALASQSKLVGQRRNRSAHSGQGRPGPPERVTDGVHRCAVPDACTGIERSKIEGADVELTLEFRIRREQHLEPAVEAVPVDQVGPYSTTDAVAGLTNNHSASGSVENSRCGESGQASTDDHDVGSCGVRVEHHQSSK